LSLSAPVAECPRPGLVMVLGAAAAKRSYYTWRAAGPAFIY